MEKQITVWIGAVLLLAALNCSEAEVIPTYFEDRGTITLRPTVTETITAILWKYNGNLLAEWVKGEVELFYYDKYQGRTTLNAATGQLEIKNMDKDDVGSYTVEINNKVHGQSFDVKWITRVPKPIVVFRPLTCGPKSESCTVTCDVKDADSLRDAEPIEYSWKMGEKTLEMMMKNIIITSAQTETEYIKTISCRMKNSVSQEDSELIQNPMYTEPDTPSTSVGTIVGCVIGVLILIQVAVYVLLWIFKRELIYRLIGPCGCVNDPEAGKETGHQLVPTEENPDSSPVAPPANSTEAPPKNSTEAPPTNSTEAPPANSTEAPPTNSTEVQPKNPTEAPTDSPSDVQPLNPPVTPDLPPPEN